MIKCYYGSCVVKSQRSDGSTNIQTVSFCAATDSVAEAIGLSIQKAQERYPENQGYSIHGLGMCEMTDNACRIAATPQTVRDLVRIAIQCSSAEEMRSCVERIAANLGILESKP